MSIKKGRGEKGERGRKGKKGGGDKAVEDTQSEVSYVMADTDLTRSKTSKKAFSECAPEMRELYRVHMFELCNSVMYVRVYMCIGRLVNI